MLRPRIIPCLLLKDAGLVKTVGFESPKYVGDPINAVRIFNEKEVDEIIVLDIDASRQGREPDYQMVEHLAAECRMPLCYGGGVRSAAQIERLIGLGVEKVAVSSALIDRDAIIGEASSSVGSQSLVAVLDVRQSSDGTGYEVFVLNGTRGTGHSPVELARKYAELGIGEIVVNSIDRDGKMSGYDHELFAAIRKAVDVPVTCLGGAGSVDHLADLLRNFGHVGAAAGSLFVFKGIYKAVLINYPNRKTKSMLIEAAHQGDSSRGA